MLLIRCAHLVWIQVFIISSPVLVTCANDTADNTNTSSTSNGSSSKQTGNATEEDASYWNNVAEEELKVQLELEKNTNVAKRIVIFIGDGMGISTITAGRIYDGQSKGGNGENNSLSFENFSYTGLIKTYAVDKQVIDSAAGAQAIFSGAKTNYGMLGVDANVVENDCAASLKEEYRTENIFSWAQKKGFATGFVGTVAVTDATLAAVYSHTSSRHWECNAEVPEEAVKLGCKDIATQMMENDVGKNLQVRMGGGRQFFQSNSTNTADDPIITDDCIRNGSRDLVEEWIDEQKVNESEYAYATTREHLTAAREKKPKRILGLFSNGDLKAEYERNRTNSSEPSLSEMAEAAIEILNEQSDTLLLLVEGANIDNYHHLNSPFYALGETQEFSNAVTAVINALEKFGSLDDTLLIVTADHSHTMVIRGYPKRGHNILGLAGVSDIDGISYTTLSYSIGYAMNLTLNATTGNFTRRYWTEEETTDPSFRQEAPVPMKRETHAGEDVAVFARGPMSHLFTGVHEQNYIAHAIAYAACIGRHDTENCRSRTGI